jgi:hypothetical protein
MSNESNLIESFELLRILNSLKFLNYLVQTHSNISWTSLLKIFIAELVPY